MNFDMDLVTSNAIVAVPIVVAIVESVKLTGWVRDYYIPFVSIAVGMIISFLSNSSPDLSANLLSGVVFGLMASGLYSGVKTTMFATARLRAERNEKSSSRKK